MTYEELVRQRVEIINAGDYGSLGDVLAPDVITHYGSGPAVHGLEALAGLLAGFEAFTEMRVSIDDLAVDGDRVGARYTTRARQRGEFAGIASTGANVEFGGAGIHRIEDGKIAEVWTVDDWATLTRQLRAPGLVTSTGAGASATSPARGVRKASAEVVAQNKRVVAHWIELINARAFGRLSEDWAVDAAIHQNRDVDDVVGLDNIVALLEMFYLGMPDLGIRVEDVVGEGDVVFLRSSSHGTHAGELFGVAGSGRPVDYNGIATYRVVDGRITYEWFNDDMFALMQAISPDADIYARETSS
jgi:predicted ester cyclase